MESFVQVFVNGLVIGLTLILVALGMTLVFGVLHIINMAHGELFMLGALGTWYFSQGMHLNYWLSMIVSIVLLAVFGAILERLLFRRQRSNLLGGMILSVGLILILQALAAYALDNQSVLLTSPFTGNVSFLGAKIGTARVAVIVISAVMVLATIAYVGKSAVGRAMRAVAQDAEAATLSGIDVNRIAMYGMGIGAAMAGVAGGLLTMSLSVSPMMGSGYLFMGLIAIGLGGMGNIAGALMASLIIGMVQSFSITYLSGSISDMILFAILFAIIMFRPEGLMGSAYVHEVRK